MPQSMPQASWVEGANDSHGFGLNHLPYGAFIGRDKNRADFSGPHLCVRIGEMLLDIHACAADGLLLELSPELFEPLRQPVWNSFLALGPIAWQALRQALTGLLAENASGETKTSVDGFLHFIEHCELLLPIAVGGYTDFYASLYHARRVGELFRPDNPLLPNYKNVPIAYNGRASSVVVSETNVRRPSGQQRPRSEGAAPEFAPTAALDYEAELAFVIGTGNTLGKPIPIAQASENLFGVTLLNDWSARDIQAWEYQPLGPFLGKSFATSISPWITPMAALGPSRLAPSARAQDDPALLPYLTSSEDQQHGALDIAIEVHLSTAASRLTGTPPMPLSRSNTRDLYWTSAQLVAHHTSNGCNLQPGDLLATGTISGAQRAAAGCLLEMTRNGAEPLNLPNGEQRAWLLDGDEITLTARCQREGLPPICLGECRGRIGAAPRP